jgi:hypothetical protein
MRKLIGLSVSAGLLATSIGAAAASDVSVWRYTVSECLRAQQAQDAQARLYHEASAFVGLGHSGDMKAESNDQRTGQ